MKPFSGVAANGLPYAKISDHGPKLVIFTGSELVHQPPNTTTIRGYQLGMPRLTRQYTVYLTSRKVGLPRGYTAQDMSEDFCEFIRSEIGEPVHIMGLSSGGSSAMHLAADHPEWVNKLVLGMTGYRLNDHGVRIAALWRDLVLAGDWKALYAQMGVDVAEGSAPEWLIRPLMRWFGGAILGVPKDGMDLAVVLESDMHLQVEHKLGQISKPTLVIGGSKDPFYGAENIRETAQRIPGAQLRLIEGGHAVVKSKPRAFESALLEFLQQPVRQDIPVYGSA